MDFTEGLPTSSGYTIIMVVVDRFTKYAHFLPLKHSYSAQSVASLFLDNVVKLHGVPKSIVSDRDKTFTTAFWKALFGMLDVKLQTSSAYHPQTDGQTERVNQSLKLYLRCVVNANPRQWGKWLSLAKLWYNSSHHSSLNCSPFKALYGVEPSLGLTPTLNATSSLEAATSLAKRQQLSKMLKDQLTRAQNKMKLQADLDRLPRQFQVGEQALLKLQPYTQTFVANRPYPKLALKYYGPYTIIEKIGSVGYKLDLPAHSQVHLIFHVSQLKPFTPDHRPVFSKLPAAPNLDVAELVPERVLDRRLTKQHLTLMWLS
jgi:hypothetical protein